MKKKKIMMLFAHRHRLENLGWVNHKSTEPEQYPENIGIKLCIHYLDQTSNLILSFVCNQDYFSTKQENLLDPEKAHQSLSPYLYSLGLSTNWHQTLIEKIVTFYRDTKNRATQKSEEELPVMHFRILVEEWEMYDDDDDEEAIQRVIEESMEDDFGKTTTPAAKSGIDALEKVGFDCLESKEKCVICLEKFHGMVMKQVTRMPCGHMFHGDCIVQWLETSHLCPLCRFEMPT